METQKQELQQEYDQQTKYLLAERQMASEARLKAQNGELRVEDAELLLIAKTMPYEANMSVYDKLKDIQKVKRGVKVICTKPEEVKQEQSLIRQRLDSDRKATPLPNSSGLHRKDGGSQLSM